MGAPDTVAVFDDDAIRARPSFADRIDDVGEIGQGGMGSLRKVFDRYLRRQVVLKRPIRGRHRGDLALLIAEAQITGQLEHPNIPPIYDLGVDDAGVHFFTMKHLDGETLQQVISRPDFSITNERNVFRALSAIIQVCNAVAFAHSRGVLHCDIKPSNIMLGEHGEVYLLDWGLARLRDAATHDCRAGARKRDERDAVHIIRGTIGYMSPEQALGLDNDLDERADVFSLGAVLYAILVGRAPYTDENERVLLQRARKAEFVPPAQTERGRAIPSRLCQIIERAMAANRDDRYQSAGELREALEDYQRGIGRETIVFAPGAVIMREGEAGDNAYVIVKGRCEATKVVDGQRRVLREMGPGDIFGEMAIISKDRRSATVEAVDETEVVVVRGESLESEMGQNPVVARVVKVLAARFRELDLRAEK